MIPTGCHNSNMPALDGLLGTSEGSEPAALLQRTSTKAPQQKTYRKAGWDGYVDMNAFLKTQVLCSDFFCSSY